MPWSDSYDPPPPPEERRPAVISRIIGLVLVGFILGYCARSWFPAGEADQRALEEHAAVGTGDVDRSRTP